MSTVGACVFTSVDVIRGDVKDEGNLSEQEGQPPCVSSLCLPRPQMAYGQPCVMTSGAWPRPPLCATSCGRARLWQCHRGPLGAGRLDNVRTVGSESRLGENVPRGGAGHHGRQLGSRPPTPGLVSFPNLCVALVDCPSLSR